MSNSILYCPKIKTSFGVSYTAVFALALKFDPAPHIWLEAITSLYLHLCPGEALQQILCVNIAPRVHHWGGGNSGPTRGRGAPGHWTHPLRRSARPPLGTETNALAEGNQLDYTHWFTTSEGEPQHCSINEQGIWLDVNKLMSSDTHKKQPQWLYLITSVEAKGECCRILAGHTGKLRTKGPEPGRQSRKRDQWHRTTKQTNWCYHCFLKITLKKRMSQALPRLLP